MVLKELTKNQSMILFKLKKWSFVEVVVVVVIKVGVLDIVVIDVAKSVEKNRWDAEDVWQLGTERVKVW